MFKKDLILGLQHTLAMFSSTILIPILMGFDIPVALFMAGIGTLIFHFFTDWKVPIFLGSSGSFVGGVLIINESFGSQVSYGAIATSGIVYILASLVAYLVGYKNFIKFFPPIVVAPIIMLIGITLSPVAVGMAAQNWMLALITMTTVIVVGIFAKGFFKLIPIISGIAVGYISSIFMNEVDFKPIVEAAWFALPKFSTPEFNLSAITILVPIALVTIMEHIGEVGANAHIVKKNWFEKPGLHKTLLGNGISISIAGLIGAPPSTTYGENTATLAVTKQYNPKVIRVAAIMAIVMAFLGKFTAFITTIPTPVMGGICFILFGMLITIGLQQLVESKVDLHNMKNSSVVLITLIVGISSITTNVISIAITKNIVLSGLSLAAVIALLLNLIINVLFRKKEE